MIKSGVLKTIIVLQDDQTNVLCEIISVVQLVKIGVIQTDHASVLTTSLVLCYENNWSKSTY